MKDRSTDILASFSRTAKSWLGMFWSTLYEDMDVLDALTTGVAVSADQADSDRVEAVCARDHEESPAYRRVHLSPVVVRKSTRNMSPVLKIGMPGSPRVGRQSDGVLYEDGSSFVVGRNMDRSRVVTYAVDGPCPVRVDTCVSDRIERPTVMLSPESDFYFDDGVLFVIGEFDPFSSGDFMKVQDGGDELAVLWAVDAMYDVDGVYEFLGYPLGIRTGSDERSRDMLSALWDATIHGLTPASFNRIVGLLYGVPVALRDETVESVESDGSSHVVVTDSGSYSFRGAGPSPSVVAGARLRPGDFLSGGVDVHWSLSSSECSRLIADGTIASFTVPAGGVAGRQTSLVVSGLEELRAYIPAMLNTCLVVTDVDFPADRLSADAYRRLRELVPAYSGVAFVQSVEVSRAGPVSASRSVSLAAELPSARPSLESSTTVSAVRSPNRPV